MRKDLLVVAIGALAVGSLCGCNSLRSSRPTHGTAIRHALKPAGPGGCGCETGGMTCKVLNITDPPTAAPPQPDRRPIGPTLPPPMPKQDAPTGLTPQWEKPPAAPPASPTPKSGKAAPGVRPMEEVIPVPPPAGKPGPSVTPVTPEGEVVPVRPKADPEARPMSLPDLSRQPVDPDAVFAVAPAPPAADSKPLPPPAEIKQTSTRSVAPSPAVADGMSNDYRTLTGQVQQWRRSWRLRYATADVDDPHGGSVLLVGGAELGKLRDGQRVRVQGTLVPAEDRHGTARYQVRAVDVLE